MTAFFLGNKMSFFLRKTVGNLKSVNLEIISEDHMNLSLKNIFYVFLEESYLKINIWG